MSKYYTTYNGLKVPDPEILTEDIENLTDLERFYLFDFYFCRMNFRSNFGKEEKEILDQAIQDSRLKCILLNFGYNSEMKPLYNCYALFLPLDIDQTKEYELFLKRYSELIKPSIMDLLQSILLPETDLDK